ncbi:8179_t:CDS:2 [Ambispora gerdemannii]|uniref:8179_t:CDS:1 n=1 Tax=Ambispora gerdemannii TaxID=144530 RepID=A0A9N9GP24_9GLOM|nr:8179_t:CDS:2 [Ambispora gerdemannii]
MSTYTNSDSYSFVRTFSNVSRASAGDSVDVVPERMPEYHYYRTLWWEKGEFNPKAKWEKATLPYKLAIGVTLEEYERRSEEFNIHGYWEWVNGKVIIYELPSKPHEICIGVITRMLLNQTNAVAFTNAEIYSLGSTRTYADDSAKEADNSFRPEKLEAKYPNGIDKGTDPWPNLVIEVAYSETIDHVTDKVNTYWLKPDRAHDAIVVKIVPVPDNQIPTRMIAWHYCVSDRITRGILPARTSFEFGTIDENGNPLAFSQGTRVINIALSCLYHDKVHSTEDISPTSSTTENHLADCRPRGATLKGHKISDTEAEDEPCGDLEKYPLNHNQNSESTILNISNNFNTGDLIESEREVIIKLDKNLITEQELKQQLSTYILAPITPVRLRDQDSSSVTAESIVHAFYKAIQSGQEGILYWYYFIEKYDKKIDKIVISGVKRKTVTSMVYQEIKQLLPDITDKNLRQKILRARKIYTLFNTLGVEKIKQVSYSADAISSLTYQQIQNIIDHVISKTVKNSSRSDQCNGNVPATSPISPNHISSHSATTFCNSSNPDDLPKASSEKVSLEKFPETKVSVSSLDTKANVGESQSLITTLSNDEPEDFSNNNEADDMCIMYSDDDDAGYYYNLNSREKFYKDPSIECFA